jgi:hypothetical protein
LLGEFSSGAPWIVGTCTPCLARTCFRDDADTHTIELPFPLTTISYRHDGDLKLPIAACTPTYTITCLLLHPVSSRSSPLPARVTESKKFPARSGGRAANGFCASAAGIHRRSCHVVPVASLQQECMLKSKIFHLPESDDTFLTRRRIPAKQAVLLRLGSPRNTCDDPDGTLAIHHSSLPTCPREEKKIIIPAHLYHPVPGISHPICDIL